jgi:hypothetical protein
VQVLQLKARLPELQGETKQALKLEALLPEFRQGEAKMAVEQLPCRFSWRRSDYATTAYQGCASNARRIASTRRRLTPKSYVPVRAADRTWIFLAGRSK